MHPERVKEIQRHLELVQADLPALAASIAHLEAMLAMPTDERLTAMQQRYHEMEKERNDYAQNIVQLLEQQRHNAHLLISAQRELDSYAASWDALSDALGAFDPKAYSEGFEDDSQTVDAVKMLLEELQQFRAMPEGEGDYRALLKERNELINQLNRTIQQNAELSKTISWQGDQRSKGLADINKAQNQLDEARTFARRLRVTVQRDPEQAREDVVNLYRALGIGSEIGL